jgi:hypothetical protein
VSRHTLAVTAIIYSDERGLTGFVEGFVGVIAYGKTSREVIKQLRQNLQFYFAENQDAFAMMMEPVIMGARRERFAVEVELPDTVDLDE